MKKLLLLTSFFMIVCASYAHSNIKFLFEKCNEFRITEEWDNFQEARSALERKINDIGADYQAPYWKEFNLITLKALLQKGDYRHAYKFIYNEAHHYFSDLNESDKYEGSCALLHKRLITPTENLRPYAALHANHIHELILALAEHDLYTDDLENAFALCTTILSNSKVEKHKPRNHFTITDKYFVARALMLRGQVAFHLGRIDQAQQDFTEATTPLYRDYKQERGYAYHGLSRIALKHNDLQQAGLYRAFAIFCFAGKAKATAYANLVRADILSRSDSTKQIAIDLLYETISIFFGLDDQYGRGLGLLQLYKIYETTDQNYEHYHLHELAGNIAQKKYEPLLMRLFMGREYEPTTETPDTEDDDNFSCDEASYAHDKGEDLRYHTYPIELDSEPFSASFKGINNHNLDQPRILSQTKLDFLAECRFPDREHPKIKEMIKNRWEECKEKIISEPIKCAKINPRVQSPIIGESESSGSYITASTDPLDSSPEIVASPQLNASPISLNDVIFQTSDSYILPSTQIIPTTQGTD